MKNDKIIHAYDSVGPDSGAEERIWQRIKQAAEARAERKPVRQLGSAAQAAEAPRLLQAKKDRPVLRWALSAAACVAVAASALALGYVAYQKWGHSAPSPYGTATTASAGPQQTRDHTAETEADPTAPTEGTMESWCLRQAQGILSDAGFAELVPEQVSVTVKPWNSSFGPDRDEVVVSLERDGEPISVTFDREDGVLLDISGFDLSVCGAPCADQDEADALVLRFYESLPVEQGYEIAGRNEYDPDQWVYDLCREVEPGLYSWYECVRIRLNPETGEAKFWKAFYVPLLDDHTPEDVPITRDEAIEIAGFDSNYDPEDTTQGVLTVQKKVAVTREGFYEYGKSRQNVSRICWEVRYEEPESEDYIAGGRIFYMDYYTGKIINTNIW